MGTKGRGGRRVAKGAGFGVGRVVALTGVHRVTLHAWDRSGFLKPSLAGGGRGPGNRRRYSFSDVMALRVARRLRDVGMSLRALRAVVEHVHALGASGKPDPYDDRLLVATGGNLKALSRREAGRVFAEPTDDPLVVSVDLETEARKLRRAAAANDTQDPSTGGAR